MKRELSNLNVPKMFLPTKKSILKEKKKIVLKIIFAVTSSNGLQQLASLLLALSFLVSL